MLKILLFALFLIPPLYLLYLISMYLITRVPYVATPRKRITEILNHMGITPDTVIYDLGCGKGNMLFAAEKLHPQKLVGFELSPIHAWYAMAKAKISRSKVKIYRRNFSTADIAEADIIYLFLVQSAVETISQKIQKEAKSNARIFVLSNRIRDLPYTHFPLEYSGKSGKGGLYIYTVPPRSQ